MATIYIKPCVLACCYNTTRKWANDATKAEKITPAYPHGELGGDARDRLWLQPGSMQKIQHPISSNSSTVI